MSRSLTICLPYLPPVAYSSNSRSHWTARRGSNRAANNTVYADVLQQVRELRWPGPPMAQARLSVTFGLPDQRRRDSDGLQQRMKPVFDALVRAEVLRDDSLAVIGWPSYRHVYDAEHRGYTMLRIEEVQQ